MTPAVWTMTSQHGLHSALGELFDLLRIGDSWTDFFAVYLGEPGEFGRDYG